MSPPPQTPPSIHTISQHIATTQSRTAYKLRNVHDLAEMLSSRSERLLREHIQKHPDIDCSSNGDLYAFMLETAGRTSRLIAWLYAGLACWLAKRDGEVEEGLCNIEEATELQFRDLNSSQNLNWGKLELGKEGSEENDRLMESWDAFYHASGKELRRRDGRAQQMMRRKMERWTLKECGCEVFVFNFGKTPEEWVEGNREEDRRSAEGAEKMAKWSDGGQLRMR